MSWIKEISYFESSGELRKMYDRVKGPGNNVDNILSVHSIRPHTLTGHMTMYKNVLHSSNNTLPKWYLETLGVYVSHLNQCDYCYKHHLAGLTRLLNDKDRTKTITECIKENSFANAFEEKLLSGFSYAEKLTLNPQKMLKTDYDLMRENGLSDGEILEINQVVSYFNYVNRTVLGLGVNTDGDILGLSPNDSEDSANWSHS